MDSGKNQPQSQTESQNVFSYCFTDVDHFTEFLAYRQIKLIQLTPGKLESEFLSVKIGDLYFTRSSANQAIQSCGQKHQKYVTFTILWFTEGSNFYSHALPLCPQTSLFGFDRHREVDLVSSQQGMMTEIFIPVETFLAYANQLQRHDLDDRFLAINYASILPDKMAELKHYLQQLFWLVKHNPAWLQQPDIATLITNDIIPLLIMEIPINRSYSPSLKPSRRSRLISQAQEEMLAHLEKPLTLKELATRLGSSSSALSYGFQDLFGMSPMRYLKVRRLNAVRRCLKVSDPESCSIATLANKFGFWSGGHFARDYKTMFGELPSDTLQTAAKVTGG
ncbi:MAG: helix-turn-helix domain-containing protein [Nostocaceae cyanobacterium]|nr:helix-turn-helix domain-containing protein [Nostocaceae cyanobacterium]